jgi:glutamate dehydrogenase (NAD(P)+)
LPAALGGIPLDDLGATGWGLSHAADIGARHCGLTLAGARLAIQGFGAVGTHAARFLGEKGVRLIAASDSGGTVHDSAGLDVAQLIALKKAGKGVRDYAAGDTLDRDAIIDIACDIWIPAARPDVIREDNVDRLQTKLVLQGANIPFSPGAEQMLHDRGVLIVPDFIANAGGVICAAMEYHGATAAQAFQVIGEKVRENVEAVLCEADAAQRPPRQAATHLACARVEEAMGYRRFRSM